jgi:drug/metabolite transporter (DMT)-like permease
VTVTSDRREVGATRAVRWSDGLVAGSLGVLCFSGTLPATRLAAPVFGSSVVTFARIDIAAVIGVLTLVATRRLAFPGRQHLAGIVVTGLGLAIGFPFFLALAVEHVPASHAAVVVGLTPAGTAVVAVLRTAERPRPLFWAGCTMGLAAVVVFTVTQGGGRLEVADVWLLAAVLCSSVGYVEGGRVSREVGPTPMLCWAMIVLAPFAAAGLAASLALHPVGAIPPGAWAGFWYVGIVSMFLGAVVWYRGLAQGGTARIGQLNLVQPLLALAWSALLLHERITWAVGATAMVVVVSVALCVNSRSRA